MAMGRADYENVARILKGLPSKEQIRESAVVSACQVFRARPTFDSKRFAKEAGVLPCPVGDCTFISEHEIVINAHLSVDHKKEEVKQCQ